jgi:anti-anti-sigma regulatory factor
VRPQTRAVSSPIPGPPAPRGVVRLLNTAGGRALCLAGAVDEAVVESFLRRYGREPARVDVIDAGSVTSLSGAALELLRDHLDAAALAGRPLALRRSPSVERLLPPGIAGSR